MPKRALVVLADGYEDIEAVTAIDVLTRAGVNVTVAGLSGGVVKGAYGSRLVTETAIKDIDIEELFDAIVLPGGAVNARNLAASAKTVELVNRHFQSGRLVAAICASPSHVLGEAAGILKGRRATGDPSFNEKLGASGAIVTKEPVTVDGRIITATGPGSALLFGLMVVEMLTDKETADGLAARWEIRR